MSDSDVTVMEDEINLLDGLQTVLENLRLLVLGPLLVGLLVLAGSFALTPVYTARTQFLVPQQNQGAAAGMLASLGALGGLAGAASGLKNPTDQYVSFLKSAALRDALIDTLDLRARYSVGYQEDARQALDGRVKITAGKDGLMVVESDDQDPAFAAVLANAHVKALQDLLGRLAVTEAQQRRLFFETQLAKVREKLDAAESALKATGVSGAVLKSNPASAVAAVATLQAQITAQQVRIGAMRAYLAETAPDLRQALAELASLRVQLARQSDPVASSVAAPQEGDYITKYRDFKYQEALYELMARQYEMARVDEAREGAVIQVLDPAQTPERKSRPRRALLASMAALLTGVLLLMGVFVRQAWQRMRADPAQSQRLQALALAWHRAIHRAPR